MKRMVYLFSILFLIYTLQCKAQKLTSDDFGVSTRQNITYVMLKPSGQYARIIEERIGPEKLPHPNQVNLIHIGNAIISDEDQIQQYKIPNRIIEVLYFKDGKFTYENIVNMARYTMTDADALTFNATSVGQSGSAERKYYKSILGGNWILLYSIEDLHSQEEEYDRIDERNRQIAAKSGEEFKKVDRILVGYLAKLKVKLFRIGLNSDEELAKFEQYVFSDFDENKPEEIKEKIFKYDFPLITSYKWQKTIDLRKTQPKNLAELRGLTERDFLLKLLSPDFIMKKINFFIEKRMENFKVKRSVYETKPDILIKVGTKENMHTNDRMVIYEKVLGRDGKEKIKRVGAIRLIGKPVENRDYATGKQNPSRFKQYFGRKIEKGMLAETFASKHLFQIGYLPGDFQFQWGWVLKKSFTYLLVGFEVYPTEWDNQVVNTVLLHGGINKEIVLAPNFTLDLHPGLFIGFMSYGDREQSGSDEYQYKYTENSGEDTDSEQNKNDGIGLYLFPSMNFYVSPSTKFGVQFRLSQYLFYNNDNELKNTPQKARINLFIQFEF